MAKIVIQVRKAQIVDACAKMELIRSECCDGELISEGVGALVSQWSFCGYKCKRSTSYYKRK